MILFDILFPQFCCFCGHRVRGIEGSVCIDCLEKIDFTRFVSCSICSRESRLTNSAEFICSDCIAHRPAYERAIICARFTGAIRELLLHLKYHNRYDLAPTFGEILAATFHAQLAFKGITHIMPVPSHWLKLRRRGYNQAELIARELAKRVHLPVVTNALQRSKGLGTQTRLTRAQRFANATASFALAPNLPTLHGQTILLVDDLMTTGATLNACARHLKAGGAERVYVLAIARGLR